MKIEAAREREKERGFVCWSCFSLQFSALKNVSIGFGLV